MGKVRAVTRLCELYTGICLTTEETHGKTSVKVAEECQLKQIFKKKCASCWSFSHMCITMHGLEVVKFSTGL